MYREEDDLDTPLQQRQVRSGGRAGKAGETGIAAGSKAFYAKAISIH